MNIYQLKPIALSLLLLLVVSCGFDDEPSDSISPANAFRNLSDIEMGLYGAYAVLGTSLMESSTIVSDEIRMPGENTVSNTDAHRWLYDSGSGSVTSAFYSFYQAIDRANRVLENIDKIEMTSGNENLRNQYKGELLAVRAYAHFELLRGYASGYETGDMGIPYMKKSEVIYPARDAVGQNYEDIAQDLEDAKALLPDSFKEVTRITKTGVSAIQARLALYRKNWQNAADFAGEVIAQKPLASSFDFPSIWNDQTNDEVVWKLDRVTGDSPYGSLFFRESGGIALYVPSFKWLSEFEGEEDQDVRFQAYIDYQPDRNASDPKKSNYLVKKYVGNNPSEPGLSHIKLFRTGEMYLIRAEAYAELDQLDKGNKDLNDLLSRRIQGYTAQSFSSKTDLVEAIYTERYKELAFEGHRFFDLKRRKRPIERWEEDLMDTAQKKTMTPSEAQYNFPIPADELAVNENIEQNPNY